VHETEALCRLVAARIGYLATVGSGGRPHIVPFVFAVDGRTIVSMIDAKPKRSTDLRRIRNIRANPSVSVLVDHYDEEWSRLWWARADGSAQIVDSGFDRSEGLLRAKYAQYSTLDLVGPAILIDIERVTGWEAVAG
jgi:PPOX class probable F420-dependent enzyme